MKKGKRKINGYDEEARLWRGDKAIPTE